MTEEDLEKRLLVAETRIAALEDCVRDLIRVTNNSVRVDPNTWSTIPEVVLTPSLDNLELSTYSGISIKNYWELYNYWTTKYDNEQELTKLLLKEN